MIMIDFTIFAKIIIIIMIMITDQTEPLSRLIGAGWGWSKWRSPVNDHYNHDDNDDCGGDDDANGDDDDGDNVDDVDSSTLK